MKNTNDSKAETLESIRVITKDIDAKESDIKTLKGQIKDIVEQLPEFIAVVDMQAELKEAKDKLKMRLMGNNQYNNLMEKLGSISENLKEDKEILSSYLVEYYATTREHQVELNPINGDAREVIVTGKLGKEQKYQTNLFGSGVEISIDGDTI